MRKNALAIRRYVSKDKHRNLLAVDRVKQAIAAYAELLKKKFPNIRFINDSIFRGRHRHKHVMGIFVSDYATRQIPAYVYIKINGRKKRVYTRIIKGLGNPVALGGVTGSLAHEDTSHYTGSACCMVTDDRGNTFLVTNAHVLTEGVLQNPLFATDGKNVLYEDNAVGTWYYGQMDNAGDFALVKLEDETGAAFGQIYFENEIRVINKSDWHSLEVIACGNKNNGIQKAYVIELIQNQVPVDYKYGDRILLNEAIQIASSRNINDCKPVTDHGDSGGAVYDTSNMLIAIITGMDDKFTYAIPLQTFFSHLHLNIKNTL